MRGLAPLTDVLEWEDGAGGGAEEWGRAPRGGALDALAAGGCEWAAVRVGAGGAEDVGCGTGETVHVAEGR